MKPTREDDTAIVENEQSQTPGSYPAGLEATITLGDGVTLFLRPIRSDDDERLIEFHHRLSVDTIYRRYFSVHPELSPEEVHHLTNVDYVNRLALVVLDGDELVAVARYDRLPDSATAEVAFVVRDAYQHLGLGHHLLTALSDAAWQRGIAEFTAETLFANHEMIAVFRHSGFPVASERDDGDIIVHFPIDPTRRTNP
ncbi:MAG: N-acetyltransferase family protein [Acidimicrobiales bacterium]